MDGVGRAENRRRLTLPRRRAGFPAFLLQGWFGDERRRLAWFGPVRGFGDAQACGSADPRP